jgi:hypothetical protein
MFFDKAPHPNPLPEKGEGIKGIFKIEILYPLKGGSYRFKGMFQSFGWNLRTRK